MPSMGSSKARAPVATTTSSGCSAAISSGSAFTPRRTSTPAFCARTTHERTISAIGPLPGGNDARRMFPPNAGASSSRITSCPRSELMAAAASPATPPPITTIRLAATAAGTVSHSCPKRGFTKQRMGLPAYMLATHPCRQAMASYPLRSLRRICGASRGPPSSGGRMPQDRISPARSKAQANTDR